MADKKISQLTGAATPLAGTEVLPIVQGGSTVKVSVDNLTAGKSVSAASFVPTSATVPTNGIFLGAANSVSVATNSTEHWMVNASGNLNPVGTKGIGTNSAPVSEAVATTFSTSAASAGSNLTGNTLAADGTDTNIDINITPKGTGEVNITKVDIDAGAIDGTAIGASSASTGAFTTLTATSLVTSAQVASQKTGTTTKVEGVGFQAYFSPGANTTFTFTPGSGLTWAFLISEGNGGGGALIFCSYVSATITIVASAFGARSVAATNAPTANEIGVYKSADSSVISFVTGSSWNASVAICVLGDYVSAVTDPA